MKKVSGLLAQSEGAAKSVEVLSLPGHLKVEGLRCGSSVLNCEVKEPFYFKERLMAAMNTRSSARILHISHTAYWIYMGKMRQACDETWCLLPAIWNPVS